MLTAYIEVVELRHLAISVLTARLKSRVTVSSDHKSKQMLLVMMRDLSKTL